MDDYALEPDEPMVTFNVEDVPELLLQALELLGAVEMNEADVPDAVKVEAWALRRMVDERIQS
jgi:hypothetical protein